MPEPSTPSACPSTITPYTVTELTKEIKARLKAMSTVWVVGEISNLKCDNKTGHIYLTLKDKDTQISATIWKHSVKEIAATLKDGIEVLVSGEVSAYNGRYQISVQSLELRGIGALLLAFENLKKKLAALGLFADEHKVPLPYMSRKICIITSKSGAAVHDILNAIMKRFPNVEVLIYSVKVQGDGSAAEIAEAIRAVNQDPYFAGVEVIIVGRGGGSLEDLLAFNEESVAYAIYESRIPIVSAVGHEVDWMISDLVADKRAQTPTEAGTIVVPDRSQLLHALAIRKQGLENAIRHRLTNLKAQLSRLATHRAFQKPAASLQNYEHRLRFLQQRLSDHFNRRVQTRTLWLSKIEGRLQRQEPSLKQQQYRHRLEVAERHLRQAIIRCQEAERRRLDNYKSRIDGLSPLAVLRRGYSIAYDFLGKKVVSEGDQVAIGDRLWIRVAESWILVRVESIGKGSAAFVEKSV